MDYELKAQALLENLCAGHTLSADSFDHLTDAFDNLIQASNSLYREAEAHRALGQIEGILLTLVEYRTLPEDDAEALQKLATEIITDCTGEDL